MTDSAIETIRLQPGQELANGKYVVTALLGAGAMGTVYKAEHRALHRDVAIKVMHPEVFERQPKAAKRFEREARAAAALDHANSVRVLDFGIEGRMHYLVMEFVEGRSLDQVVRQDGTFDDGRIARLMSQVCSALAKAHDAGTIHRDLKPQNILLVPGVDDEGLPSEEIKVCDFGIAKVSWAEPGESDDALTEAGSVMGTPQYMSPEQCQAEELDARSDLYSLGCVMYFLATGKHPFDAPTPLTMMLMHIQEAVRPPSELNPNIAPSMEAMILMAMAKERHERPVDARAFRRRLGSLIGLQIGELDTSPVERPLTDKEVGVAPTMMTPVEGISALSSDVAPPSPSNAPPDTTQTIARPAASRPAPVAAMAGVFLVLGGAAAYAMLALFGDSPEPTPAPEPAAVAAPKASGEAAPTTRDQPLEQAKPTVVTASKAAEPAPTPSATPTPEPTPTPEAKPAKPVIQEAAVVKKKPTSAKKQKKKPASKTPAKTGRVAGAVKTAPKKPSVKPAAPVQPKPVKPTTIPKAVAPELVKPKDVAPKAAKAVEKAPAVAKPAAPKSFEATARISGIRVAGSLPKSAIAKAARHLSTKFEQCYRAMARKAGRAPSVVLRIRGTIDEDGRARSMKVSSAGLAGLSGCVRSAAARLRSRVRPDTGTVDMSFEVRFVPKG